MSLQELSRDDLLKAIKTRSAYALRVTQELFRHPHRYEIEFEWAEETCLECPDLSEWVTWDEEGREGLPPTEEGLDEYLASSPSCGELCHTREYTWDGGATVVYHGDGWIDVYYDLGDQSPRQALEAALEPFGTDSIREAFDEILNASFEPSDI